MSDTPFDASLYDDMDNNTFGLSTNNNDDEEDGSLAVPADTQLYVYFDLVPAFEQLSMQLTRSYPFLTLSLKTKIKF